MFNYSSSEAVIPSLVFTKAELVYAISVLMADISPTDNSTRIEMVEVRHYLNLIKDKVALAAADGTLKGVVAASGQKADADTPSTPETPSMPSMDDLRREFPSLSEEEIKETLEIVRKERMAEAASKAKAAPPSPPPPPPPSFIAKSEPKIAEPPPRPAKPISPKDEDDKKNAEKFAQLLGSF